MNEGHDNYYNLVKRVEDAFVEIDSDFIVDLFKSNSEYASLRQKADRLLTDFPIIDNVLEDNEAISLSAAEHEALAQYFALKQKMEDAERCHIYFRGHTDNFAYLKKIGAI